MTRRRSSEGSGVQAVIAVAAIVGFGTKAGLMPMHAWLPRTHPIAPAFISALMSGVMVAVAAYGLIRVLVDWLGPPPAWVGATMLVLGGLSALGGITYALFQRDLKRLLAYSTVEHLGVVALGLGACLLLRRHGADQWAAFALGAALSSTPSTTRRSRRCSFLARACSNARPERSSSIASVAVAAAAVERRRVPHRCSRDRRDAAA